MFRRRLVLGLALSASFVLGLTGCGDDGDDAAPTSTTTTAPATTSDGSDPADASTTSTTVAGETEPGGGDDQPFCAAFAAFNVSSETHPDQTLADVQAGSVELAAHAEDMAATAPDDLADEAGTFAATFVQLRDAVATATSLEEASTAAQNLTSNPGFGAAIQAISTWTAEACTTS